MRVTIRRIADTVCPMMACMDEQGFVSEYAYAIDYVIKVSGVRISDGSPPKTPAKPLFMRLRGLFFARLIIAMIK